MNQNEIHIYIYYDALDPKLTLFLHMQSASYAN